ncbi:hypothetical protein F5B20DRAFT_581497 [Whalleya microplaca]|nr:hypothetical protein F5B20DRAFT_581497 [Whalleya microplaca]
MECGRLSAAYGLITLLVTSVVAATTCYRPDGSAVDSTYRACNGTAEYSMCCHTGVVLANGDPYNGGDACGSGASYGLCGITGTQLWRESCTDPTWKSSACLKLCADGGYSNEDAEITPCADGSYCCGKNNTDCCAQREGTFIVNDQVASSTTSSSSSSSTRTSASTPTETAASITASSTGTTSSTPLSAAIALQGSGLSDAAVAGISIAGTLVGVGVIAGVIYMVRRRRDRSKSRREQALPTGALPSHYVPRRPGSSPPGTSELDGTSLPQELPSVPLEVSELPAQKYYYR